MKEDLDDVLVDEILTPNNVGRFYLDAIAFGSDKVKKACELVIFRYFE